MRRSGLRVCLFLSCALFLSLSSCKNNLTPPLPDSLPLKDIHGRIDKWSMGDSMTVVACVRYIDNSGGTSEFFCGSAPVNNDGSFAFNLLEPPAAALENRAIETGNPDSVKFATVFFLEIRPSGHASTTSGLLNATYNITSDTSGGSHIGGYFAYFEYAARDVDMIGTSVWPFGESHFKIIYDLHYKKGWNRIIVKNVSSDAIQLSISNVNDANWYIVSDRYQSPTIIGMKVGWMPGAGQGAGSIEHRQ